MFRLVFTEPSSGHIQYLDHVPIKLIACVGSVLCIGPTRCVCVCARARACVWLIVWDMETSTARQHKPVLGFSATQKMGHPTRKI
jgi:hypothetical protein